MRKNIFLVYICFFSFIVIQNAVAQKVKYWVFFTDKDTLSYREEAHLSTKTIRNRQLLDLPLYQETDIPVKKKYIDILQKEGIQIHNTSKWFNAITAYLSKNELKKIRQYAFIKKMKPVGYSLEIAQIDNPAINKLDSSVSYPNIQLEGKAFREKKLSGKVVIGILDASFHGLKYNKYLTTLWMNNQILGVKDFVKSNDNDFFSSSSNYGMAHGASVLMRVAGKNDSSHIGFAPDAKFYLARTEDSNAEYRKEEDNWICAMEWLDSLGVRIVNTSLGYSDGFDDPKEKYKPEEMDGETALITQAAQIAAKEKGMLIVVSAGNQGNDRWKIISAPADAKEVLSVGAVNTMGLKMNYSSIGSSQVKYIKPNVSCYSDRGTSFSAPVVTGFAACLLEYQPTLSYSQIINLIEQSSHIYPFANNYIGYGVPSASRALLLLDKKNINKNQKIRAKGKTKTIKLDKSSPDVAKIFHKKDENQVKKQGYLFFDKNIKIKRRRDIKYTTVVLKDMVYEIIWK